MAVKSRKEAFKYRAERWTELGAGELLDTLAWSCSIADEDDSTITVRLL